MKPYLFLLIFSVLSISGHGQAREVELSSEYSPNNELIIKAKKHVPGTYYLEIQFTNLENTTFSNYLFTYPLKSSDEIVLQLKPSNPEVRPSAGYSYIYRRGNPKSKPDTAFVYRLPYSPHQERKVHSMHLIGGETHAQNQHNVNWHAMQFVMQANDTIYAARTGTVVEIKEMEPESNAAAQPAGHTTFRRNVNRITVEHEDETYANYSVVENIQVSLGDKVFPMTPLGIAGTYDGENYQTRLMFYYYRIAPQKKNGQTTFEFHYFRPVFATTAGEMPLTMNQNYFPLVSTELITKEMSKREARRYQGK